MSPLAMTGHGLNHVSTFPNYGLSLMKNIDFPRIDVSDGTIEALKWTAMILMVLAHINKYYFLDQLSVLYELGRLSMPLFGFILAYNLARPGIIQNGGYMRIIRRLAVFGLIASPFYIILGGRNIAFGFWPLNIMFMLLLAAAIISFIEKGSILSILLAGLLFIFGGAFVEYWWFALAFCLAAWWYCKSPGLLPFAFLIVSTALLYIINGNFWAMAVLPIVFASQYIDFKMPRFRHVFYYFYPAHLAVLWALSVFFVK